MSVRLGIELSMRADDLKLWIEARLKHRYIQDLMQQGETRKPSFVNYHKQRRTDMGCAERLSVMKEVRKLLDFDIAIHQLVVHRTTGHFMQMSTPSLIRNGACADSLLAS